MSRHPGRCGASPLCAINGRRAVKRSCNGLGSFTRRSLLRERLLVGLGDEIELRTALRSKLVARLSANLDEDTQENEGNGTDSEANAAHSLDRMNCINK